MKSFFGESRQELLRWVGRPTRAARVFRAVYQDGAESFDTLTNLPPATRRILAESLSLQLPGMAARFDSQDGTRRYLVRLDDGQTVESVRIPAGGRETFCISSQIGCGLACTFCLTGRMGLIRDLSAGEIVAQALMLSRETGLRRVSIVLMGMGEPLANYDAVIRAINILHDDHGLGVPPARITLSTAGLVPGIERLSNERIFPNLSISLSGVTNTTRDHLMPINRKYPVEAVMETVRRLPPSRQSRVMFECVMIKDVTDSPEDARELVRLLQGMRAKVNLIPLNPAPELPYERADDRSILRYQEILVRAGIATFIRRNRGNDVSGACGQLKRSSLGHGLGIDFIENQR